MIIKPTKVEAILSLVPNADFAIYDNANIVWNSHDVPPVTNEEIDAELVRLLQEYDRNQYQRKRQPEYPSIDNQLDMLWHAIDQNKLDTTSDFYQSLKAVKDKYPKGS